ncbi:hypothetical protein KP509_02G002400 [Ceratopteris richardii]|uniref:Uncharacterized protein n=1 Tax=Ceratopteris richardii TaxID=49495 RepID=A0A8T2V2U0_CERRI|nr:hypothetical protein KP509_02G002400 [Ceratopteris richardii]
MDSCRQYGDDDLSMREMCSEGFEILSPHIYRHELGSDIRLSMEAVLNHNHSSVTHEGWNDYPPEEYKSTITCGNVDEAEHLLIRDAKALSSAPADQPDLQRNQFNRSSPVDQLHVQSTRFPTITHASVKQTNIDLHKLKLIVDHPPT